jgi:3-oxoacyl-[acyl-carrier-protein] synthase I
VRGGISGITVHPHFRDRVDEPVAFARDLQIDAQASIANRMAEMLRSVLAEAADGSRSKLGDMRVGSWLGLPEARPGLDMGIAMPTLDRAFLENSLPVPQQLRRGHAAGLMALQVAALKISSGEIDVAAAAAVDSYHDAETVSALDERGWLMSALNRNGFPPGEGAGVCILATRDAASRLGLPLLGQIVAASTAIETVSMRSTEGVCVGLALTAVLNDVTSTLQRPQQVITATYCDLNGQRYRNEEFVYTLLRTQESFVDAHDYLCPADCWGDVGAASGLLFAALAIEASRRGYAKGPRPLLWAGSESGYRSAVLLNLDRG